MPYESPCPSHPVKIISNWACALRLPYFITTLIPCLLAFILAGKETGIWMWPEFLSILAGIFSAHAATNLINDYYDTINGVDNPGSVGGSRVVLDEKLTLADLSRGAVFFYLISLAAFIFFAVQTGRWWVMPGWALGFAASFFYVGPPVAYGYKGWGEPGVFVSTGWLLLLGTFIALTAKFSITALATASIFGLMSAEILFFQSLPQIDTDPLHGKKTLACKLGKAWALKVQSLSWPLIWFGCFMLPAAGLAGWGSMGAVLAFPAYVLLQRRIKSAASSGNFPVLNSEGHLVKVMFIITSLALFAGLIFPWETA